MLCKDDNYIQPFGWVINATRQILYAIAHHTHPVFSRVEKEMGPRGTSLYLAQIAIGLEPELLGIAHVYNRRPYTNPERIRADLENAVSLGWLESKEEGVYRASQKSRDHFASLRQDIEPVYRSLATLYPHQLEEIDRLLHTVVQAIEQAGGLDFTPSFDLDLKWGRRDGPVLQRICCKLSHILAFRDDAYVNAWMSENVNSYVWETFSCIYKGQAQTALEVARCLGTYRYYDLETYELALKELVERGWLLQVADTFEPSNEGIKVLAQVARSLNQSFYKPWTVLDEDQLQSLKDLIPSLAAALNVKKTNYGGGYAYINRTIGWGSVHWVRDKVR